MVSVVVAVVVTVFSGGQSCLVQASGFKVQASLPLQRARKQMYTFLARQAKHLTLTLNPNRA